MVSRERSGLLWRRHDWVMYSEGCGNGDTPGRAQPLAEAEAALNNVGEFFRGCSIPDDSEEEKVQSGTPDASKVSHAISINIDFCLRHTHSMARRGKGSRAGASRGLNLTLASLRSELVGHGVLL